MWTDQGGSLAKSPRDDQRIVGSVSIAICAADPGETGQGLRGAAIGREGGRGPLGSRPDPPANAGNRERALSSKAALAKWRRRCRSRAARRALGSVLIAGRQSRPDRTGERLFRKGIVTRMGGNPRAGFRSARPTRAPVPCALSTAKGRTGCAGQCGV